MLQFGLRQLQGRTRKYLGLRVKSRSKRLRQSRLAKDRIRRMAAWNADGNWKVGFRDRALPDFMAAFALANQVTSARGQQLAQLLVELRRHLRCRRFGFAQGGDLKEQRCRINARMIVRQQVERHGRNLRQQLVERWRIGCRRDIVTVTTPNRGLMVPSRRDCKDHWFRHR